MPHSPAAPAAPASSAPGAAASDASGSSFQITVSPLRCGLVAGRDNTVTALVRVQAPSPPPGGTTAREALHLALVLDRSGSMSGQPLEEAKRCARGIVDALAPNDRACVIVFDDEVECVAALAPVGDGVALRATLAAIDSGGSTNLHGGWHTGPSALAGSLAASGVHRAILLSDGCANHGETELEHITMQCRDLAKAGVSTSTYGLGHSFNED
jgi:Ca-activated chloride channel family protein